jgi:hypothetical protein
MWHAWETFWWESLKETDHSEDRGVDGRTVSDEIGWGVWS